MDFLSIVFDPKSIENGVFTAIFNLGGLLAIILFLANRFNKLNESVEKNENRVIAIEKQQAVQTEQIKGNEADIGELKQAIYRK